MHIKQCNFKLNFAFKHITDPKDPFFSKAIEIYTSSFPANERQPLEKVVERVASGKSQLFVAIQEENVIGMSLLWDFSSTAFVLLDYLAIAEQYRSRNVGSYFFQHLATYLGERHKYMIIEVEDPKFGDNKEQRKKRINFYLKNGAYLMEQVPYILPSLDNTEPTEMRLMIAPKYTSNSISKEEVKALIQRMYREVYEKSPEDALLQKIITTLPQTIHFSNTLLT